MIRPIPVAELLPDLTIALDDSDMVTAALVLVLVAPMEGDPTPVLHSTCTADAHWITRRGMLHAALDVERGVGDLKDQQEDE